MAIRHLILALVVVGILVTPSVAAAPPLPDPNVHYNMRARLEPDSGLVKGWLRLRLRNTAQRALSEVRLHLYLNAFSGPNTRFMSQSRGRMRYSSWDPAVPGWIKVSTINRGQTPLAGKLLHDGTVLSVALNEPLPPGEDLSLMMEFRSKLPHLFARTGVAGDFVMVAQWYPKLCFLNPDGTWHSPAYHAYDEYFAPFATYRVELTLPAGWTVGATGRTPRPDPLENSDLQRLHLEADGVHDLAFAAWPAFTKHQSREAGVNVTLLSVPGRGARDRILFNVSEALGLLQRWFLPYPYPRLTVVDMPTRALGGAGMEYPTLFTTWTPAWVPRWHRGVDVLVIHELVHQYFQGMVATNEVAEPWLDEGVTTYVTGLIADELYGANRSIFGLGAVRLGHHQNRRLSAMWSGPKPLAVGEPAASFKSSGAYMRTIYSRAALLLATVEDLVGRHAMLAALGAYVRRHAFSHPGGADLERLLLDAAPADERQAVADLLDGVVRGRKVVDYSIRCGERHIEIKRTGDLALPLKLLVVTREGMRVREVDGTPWEQEITAPRLVRATLGPVRRLGLDPTPADLSCAVAQDRGARRAAWQWTTVVQHLLQLVGP